MWDRKELDMTEQLSLSSPNIATLDILGVRALTSEFSRNTSQPITLGFTVIRVSPCSNTSRHPARVLLMTELRDS